MRLRPAVMLAVLVLFVALCARTDAAVSPARQAVELAPLGPSAGGAVVFVDAMQQSTPWQSAAPLRLDAAGELQWLARGQTATRTVYAAGQWHPTGDYTLLYDGTATFTVAGGAVVEAHPGRATVRVSDADEALLLSVESTSPANPIRRVRLILPGYLASAGSHPFYPAFLASLRGAQVLRFDAWSHARDLASSQTWVTRPRVADATQTLAIGAAPEYAIALANATGADPWFVLPMGATDAYAYGVADLVRRFLDPRLHPIFEYGDSVLSTASAANGYAQMAARNVGMTAVGPAGARAWYLRRSAELFAIESRVLAAGGAGATGVIATAADDDRLVDLGSERAIGDWRAVGGAWFSFESPARAVVAPIVDQPLRVGDDTLPSDARESRPGVALHPMPLLSSAVASPALGLGYGLAGSLGEPMQSVDLGREGSDDWLAADGSAMPIASPTGGHQLSFAVTGGDAVAAPAGYAAYEARDRNGVAEALPSSGLEADGVRAAFRVTAPADGRQRILSVYVSADRGALTATARMGAAAQPLQPLVPEGTATRDGVYTVVYRGAPGSVLTLDLRATSGRPVFRAATLTEAAKPATSPSPDETTYHNDLLRTGWNPNESTLTAADVASSQFGLLRTLHVDGVVLAQPLYVSQVAIPGHGVHNLLIVVTEHDSVFEFDADTGAFMRKARMGRSQSSQDVGCGDIIPEYGITSTPVIDRSTNTLYLVAATEPAPFVFLTKLHALDLVTLTDKVTPQELHATAVLSNGSTISYDPQNQQTRTSLVWSGSALYVGVGSHCDNNAGAITGWELRYDAQLHQTGRFATAEDSTGYFLDSIWMSGFAAALDSADDVFVVTGNGAFDIGQGGHNYGESVLKLTPTLTRVLSYFTPSNWRALNNGDIDFGSGGVMLLPPQQATVKYVAVAQGKWSTIYLLDRSRLGGMRGHDAGALQSIPGTGAGVWGGPTYYNGPTGQFVYYQSGGAPLTAYAVAPDKNGVPQLTLSSSGPSYAGYGGSTPIVSSNGQLPGTGIVWLVNRTQPLTLEAYDATDVSRLLFSGAAGMWNNPAQNGFVTPLVANGRVYVPAAGTISVFGLGSARMRPAQSIAKASTIEHHVFGTVLSVRGSTLVLRLRDGRDLAIDLSGAVSARHAGALPVGRAVIVYGYLDRRGSFHATSVGHASQNPAQWSADR